MSYSKECPGVVVTETPTGEFVSRRKCHFKESGTKPCKLSKNSGGPNNTHISEGYCLRGMPDDMPDVKSN